MGRRGRGVAGANVQRTAGAGCVAKVDADAATEALFDHRVQLDADGSDAGRAPRCRITAALLPQNTTPHRQRSRRPAPDPFQRGSQ
jgi:hypothetical protein